MEKLLMSVGISAIGYLIEKKRAEATLKEKMLGNITNAVSTHGADVLLKLLKK